MSIKREIINILNSNTTLFIMK